MRISDWSSDVCSSDLQPRIDEHVEAAGDKGVERAVIYEVQRDPLGAQPGRLEQWRGVGAAGTFDLRIAHQLKLLGCRQQRGQRAEQKQYVAHARNARFAPGYVFDFLHKYQPHVW